MTSAPSQSSDASSRRQQMLAALDIDVWTTRLPSEAVNAADLAPVVEARSGSLSSGISGEPLTAPGASEQTPGQEPAPIKRSGAGPAAALALLEQSVKPDSAWQSSTSSSATAAESSGAAETSATASAATEARNAEPVLVVPLDLWCLSGNHGVLLAQHEGLSPHAQRLLNDVLQTATRAIRSRLQAMVQADDTAKPQRTKLQALRFTWPPEQQAGSDPVGQDTARALRGFLNRQLKGAVEPILLYVGDDLAEVLGTVDLAIPAARQMALAHPEQMMSDSTAKRALWRTLSAL